MEDLVSDLGVNVAWSFVPEESKRKDPEWRHRLSNDWKKDVEDFSVKVSELKPDLVLTAEQAVVSEANKAGAGKALLVGGNIGVGFLSGIEEARKWLKEQKNEIEGRWKNDRSVFEKYYC